MGLESQSPQERAEQQRIAAEAARRRAAEAKRREEAKRKAEEEARRREAEKPQQDKATIEAKAAEARKRFQERIRNHEAEEQAKAEQIRQHEATKATLDKIRAQAQEKKAAIPPANAPHFAKTNLDSIREQALLKKEQQQNVKPQQTKFAQDLKQHPNVQRIFGQSLFFKGALALGSGAHEEQHSGPGLSDADQTSKPGGFLGGALNLINKQPKQEIAKVGEAVLKGGEVTPSMLSQIVPQTYLNFSVPTGNSISTVPAPKPVTEVPQPEEKKKDDGGWFGSLVSKAKDFGKSAVDTAKDFGNTALKAGSDAWSGASNWVSDHKAEIAIGVGVVALVAATVLTAGAAAPLAAAAGAALTTGSLAAGVTAAGGAAALGTAVVTTAAGGFVAGAGLNLAHQGAEIKDHRIDPATGKPKTDISFGDVAKSGGYGALAAPLGVAAFGAAPVVVGGLGLVAGGRSGINAYNNFTGNNFLTNNNPERTKNSWSGAIDAGETVMAAVPFASKGGRDAMFGSEARSQTLQTGTQAWTGARNWGNRALNAADEAIYGSKVLASRLSPQMATPEGLSIGPELPAPPTPRPMISGPQKQQPMMMQGSPEGPQGVGTQIPGTALHEPVPKASTSEPDVGLSNRGYRPKPGERSTTREQWNAQQSEQRAQNTVSRSDQPLENPLPNAAQRGHGDAWHGNQTTDTQQVQRLQTGIRPDGSSGNSPGQSSRFTSPQAQAEALGRGNIKLQEDLANGNVPSFTDPTTGRITYTDPVTGKPARYAVSVSTQRQGGFGTRVVKQRDLVTGQVLRDPNTGTPLTKIDPVPRTDAKVVWEYRPTTGDWQPVTYYPE